MEKPMPRYVKPTMKYLHEIIEAGYEPIDFDVCALDAGKEYRVIVPTKTGKYLDFVVLSDHETMMAHRREAVAFTGFGESGLHSLIHEEVCSAAKTLGVPLSGMAVYLSADCYDRLKRLTPQLLREEYVFYLRSRLVGTSYAIECRPESPEEPPISRIS